MPVYFDGCIVFSTLPVEILAGCMVELHIVSIILRCTRSNSLILRKFSNNNLMVPTLFPIK